MRNQLISGAALSVFVALSLTAAPTHAQDAPQPAVGPKPPSTGGTQTAATGQPGIEPSAPPASPSGLAEIVVTAQKRSESINNVGMAITALTGNQLKEQGVTDVSGLSKIEPSFVLSQSKYGAPSYTIRGIGYNDYALAASPTVSVYVDEVPFSSLVMSKAATLDLSRVEILKGPQGTLYGQNATGGAVNYIAAKPTNYFDAAIEGTYGSYGAFNANGYISGGLTDTLRARLSFATDQGGAYQKSETYGDHLGNKDLTRARLLLDWTPNDRLKVSANLNGFVDRSDTLAAQATGVVPQKLGPYPNTAIADPTLRGRTFPSIVGLGPLPAPTSDTQADWYNGVKPRLKEGFGQASLRADYTFSPAAVLTYLGTFEDYAQNDVSTSSGRPQQSYYDQRGTIQSTSQEVRLGGKLLDGRLDYVLGGEYAYSLTKENDILDYLGITTAYSTLTLPYLVGLSKTYEPPTTGTRLVSRDDSTTGAVFGNAEYHLLSNLDVHAGVRFTENDQKYAGCGEDIDGTDAAAFTALQIIGHVSPVVPAQPGQCVTLGPTGHPGLFSDKLDENNVSWRVGADWTPIPKTLIYASVSKGFKAGSFPTLAATSYVQLEPVTQESVLAYELGVKSRFLQNRVEVDGAVFYYDYRDKQLASNRPDPLGIFGIVNALVNVPKSDEKGAEFSVKLRPVEGLTLSTQVTYLDSSVDGDFMSYDQFSTVPVNLKGEPFPDTPKWSLNTGGQYDFNVNDKLRGYAGADVRYQSSAQGAFATYVSIARGYPSLEIKPYALLDLRAGVETKDGHYYVQVFGHNVTDTYYWTQAARIFDGTVRFAGMPSTFGVTVGYRY